MIYPTATAFAFALNIPTLFAAQKLPLPASVIMYATLALLGLALGVLSGWALDVAQEHEPVQTSISPEAIPQAT